MRTTLIIDDDLLERARAATNIQEITALVGRAGLQAVIAHEAGKRLVALRGNEPKLAECPTAFS